MQVLQGTALLSRDELDDQHFAGPVVWGRAEMGKVGNLQHHCRGGGGVDRPVSTSLGSTWVLPPPGGFCCF